MGLGNQVAIAVWAMTGLSLGLVALRLYTRIRIVRFVGAEDYLFVLTGLSLVAFAATLHVSVHYGLGKSLWRLDLDDSSNAIFWSYVANSFAVLGNAMAKLSMGFFLLRVVQVRFQKLALWVLIVVTAGTSIALVVMLWNQTTPRKASWDPLRTPGVWNIQIQPMSIGLGGWSSACDFFFVIFPWIFIWSLRMPRREKIMLAGSMSLGVIAGACGIFRTVFLSRLQVTDYTLNFAPYYIWACAEIAVALVCLALPTLRPLYQRNHGSTIDYTSRAYAAGAGSDPELPRFTMLSDHKSPITPQSQWSETPLSPQHTSLESPNPLQRGTKTSISSPRRTVIRDSSSSHTMVEHWQPDPAPVRSLSPCPPSPDEDVDPAIKLPLYSTEGTILRPPSIHSKRSRRDSVDDILGLYNERSRSRGGASSLGRSQPQELDTDLSHGMGVVMLDPPPGAAITTTTTIDYDVKYHHDEVWKGGETNPSTEWVVVDHRSYNDSGISNVGHDRIRTGDAEEMIKVNLDNWPLRN